MTEPGQGGSLPDVAVLQGDCRSVMPSLAGGSDPTYVRRAGDLWAYYGDDPDTAWYSAYNPDSVNYTEHDDLGSVVRV